jgi:hypothetical protein
VQQATAAVSNRFLLVHVASTLTRKFHRRMKDRLPETINSSLAGLAEGKFLLSDYPIGNGFVAIRPGVPDLDTYNGFTGEGSYSFVKPEFVEDEPTPQERMAVCSALMAAQIVETA